MRKKIIKEEMINIGVRIPLSTDIFLDELVLKFKKENKKINKQDLIRIAINEKYLHNED